MKVTLTVTVTATVTKTVTINKTVTEKVSSKCMATFMVEISLTSQGKTSVNQKLKQQLALNCIHSQRDGSTFRIETVTGQNDLY